MYLYFVSFIKLLRPRQNGRRFPDIFKCIFLNKNVWISLKISLTFVPKVPNNNTPVSVQIMVWRWPGDKPLSGPMIVSLVMHICVSQPQWINKETTQVVKTLSHGSHGGAVYPTWSMLWLLIPWQCKEPCHQQQCHSPVSPGTFWPQHPWGQTIILPNVLRSVAKNRDQGNNANPDHWCIYAVPGLSELIKQSVNLFSIHVPSNL